MKRLTVRLLTGLIIINPGITALNAQEQVTDSVEIEEIVVTGTKTSVNRNTVPLAISVISSAQIEESSESSLLPVLSELVPGVFITERGVTGFGVSTGSAGAISIRGIGGSPNTQTLILLNGNPQFMGIMGHPLPDAYVASDVEKVEVIRGPASTLYGSNAMGGVINIITKEQEEDGIRADARLMYGSYNTQKYMINGGIKKKGFNVFASFNHDQTDGHRDSSDFSINNGYFSFGYDLMEHFRVNLDFSLANFDATDPGMENANAGEAIDITRGMGAVKLDNNFLKTNGSARFFYNFGEHNITDGFHSKDNNFGLVVYQSVNFFKGNTVSVGIDLKEYGGIAENVKAMNGQGLVFGDTIVRELAGYLYFNQFLSEKVIFDAGFRLEHNNVYGFEPVPAIGLAYQPGRFTTLKFSVAKGFRSPTIRELYLWGTANSDLKPERMVNYEASLSNRFFNNKISIDLTIFKADGNNLISTVEGAYGMKYQNTGTFSNAGLEVSGVYKPVNNLSLQLNYSYVHLDKPVIATPRHQIYASCNYEWNRFAFYLSLQHINNLYTQITPTAEIQNYTLINSRIACVLNKYIDMFIKGENLTNHKYYINYGYPMPGIVIFGGINFHCESK